MVQNMEKILERGEKIELLVDKADSMKHTAFRFHKSAKDRHWQEWWNGIKMKILFGFIALVVIYVILAVVCGGPALPCMTGAGKKRMLLRAMQKPAEAAAVAAEAAYRSLAEQGARLMTQA